MTIISFPYLEILPDRYTQNTQRKRRRRREISKQILLSLYGNGAMHPSEISRSIGLSYNSCMLYLEELKNLGMINSNKKKNMWVIYITEQGRMFCDHHDTGE